MRALVLGAGPAGLLAAHAARQLNYDVVIFSHKARKSRMYGAQYLHANIPGVLCGDEYIIRYTLLGSATDYVKKVYGPRWDGTVSDEVASSLLPAWDIRMAYDMLWDEWETAVEPWSAEHAWSVAELIKQVQPDEVISSIPTQLLCMDNHEFKQINFWSTEHGAEDEILLSDDTVIYNGHDHPGWYRAALIREFLTVEWPYRFGPPSQNGPVWNVVKPMSTDCDCYPNVHRVGRYGNWTRGILAHDAYFNTYERLSR